MNRLLLTASILVLASCSTVLDGGPTQEVYFETPGALESKCRVNAGRIVYDIHPPQTVLIQKTDGPLEVDCMAEGSREKGLTVYPIVSNNTLLNAGTGFTGLAVDLHTKAPFLYPNVIRVDFTDVPYEKAAQPTYSKNPAAPNIEHIDPHRPSVPALHKSDLDPPAGLRERRRPSPVSSRTAGSNLYGTPVVPPQPGPIGPEEVK